jgi:hypothetical protein
MYVLARLGQVPGRGAAILTEIVENSVENAGSLPRGYASSGMF